ncbi:hypothetical protein LOTGIDRAFT_228043 [Lottia gigantea]|uniref:HAUS augmin-like complex subunit 3 N-terminal domain-containing protein n=1 Tax=Lottia gigantea TaxID=225164 RepID=V4BHV7_LOTGI|nr:hypothetical protein LOTGIDRAFT_228043 [Lottia gigantea]ESP05467.1 hypothetical protein LOTGIDRAFT_228043 [Lottia gigantea]
MKMSGSQFLETLQQLGYPGAEKLDPQMFDWLFEQENIVPFLHWFSNNVHSNNVLSASDRNEYDELEKCNEGILEGRQLEDALNNLTVNNRDADITEESLSEDITRLNSELEDNKEKKQMLIQRRNRLSLHHTSVSHKLTKLTPLESYGRKEHKKRLEQIQTDNNKVNESMEKLVDSVKEVTSLYDNTDPSQTKDIMFLSQAKLDDYFNAEEKYTQELTSFTRKQFFENIGRMTGENDGSRFELLDVKDPEMLLIHGESDENVFQDCKELTRLQNVYNRSESDKILAILEDKGVKGALNSADDLLSCLQSGRFPVDTNKLSTQLQEAQSSLQNVRRDLHNAKEGDLPLLVKELVPLQGNPILTGDYNLKLARQDYFTSNQDKLINLLISQKARYEFLTIAYEVEARHHRDIHRHLTAVRLQLQSHLKEWKNRMDNNGINITPTNTGFTSPVATEGISKDYLESELIKFKSEIKNLFTEVISSTVHDVSDRKRKIAADHHNKHGAAHEMSDGELSEDSVVSNRAVLTQSRFKIPCMDQEQGEVEDDDNVIDQIDNLLNNIDGNSNDEEGLAEDFVNDLFEEYSFDDKSGKEVLPKLAKIIDNLFGPAPAASAKAETAMT